MSLNLGVMSAAVTLNDTDFRNKLTGLEKSSESSFSKIAQYAATFLSLGAVYNFSRKAIATFSDLQEETNKFNVVFAGFGHETSKILDDLQNKFGLSELAAKKMLAGTGDILTGFGFDRENALAMSDAVARLGADIASFSNYSGGAEGAANALTKAMLGETESAKMLGIVIRQDSDEFKNLIQQAMTSGVHIKALNKTFVVTNEQQAKAVAALALAYQQSPNAIGDFERSITSLANQSRILQNNLQQTYAIIGGDTANVFGQSLAMLNGLLKTYNDLSPAARRITNDIILFSAAMLVLNKTQAGQKVKKFFTQDHSLEAQQKAAAEEVKRTEIARTEAVEEAYFAHKTHMIAQEKKEQAEATLSKIQMEKAAAEARGDTAAVQNAIAAETKAKEAVLKATIDVKNAEQDYAKKKIAATEASKNYKQAASQLNVINGLIAQSLTFAGKASLLFNGSLKKAALGVKAFMASIGPVGWTLMALGAAYEIINIAANKQKAATEGQNEAARRNVEAAEQRTQKVREQNAEMNKNAKALRDLSYQEELSTEEQKQAQYLVNQLNEAYGDLGFSFDEQTKKLNIAAGAWDRLTEAQRTNLNKALKEELAQKQRMTSALVAGSFNALNGWDTKNRDYAVDLIRETYMKNSNNPKKMLSEFKWLETHLIEIGDGERAAYVSKIVESLQKEVDIRKQLKQSSDEPPDDLEKRKELLKEISKLQNEMIRDNAKVYGNVETFDLQNIDKQIDEQIRKAGLREFWKKNQENITSLETEDFKDLGETQIAALQKIIELEKERRNILSQTENIGFKIADKYREYFDERQKATQERAFNQKIEKLKRNGDADAVSRLFTEQLKMAQKKADEARREFENYYNEAGSDKIFTTYEQRRLADYENIMKKAFSDVDRWQSRVDADSANKNNQLRNVVSTWSLALLKYQLGASNTPERETANNTRKMVDLMRNGKALTY